MWVLNFGVAPHSYYFYFCVGVNYTMVHFREKKSTQKTVIDFKIKVILFEKINLYLNSSSLICLKPTNLLIISFQIGRF